MAAITFGMVILGACAFNTEPLPFPWSIFETISRVVFRTQFGSQVVFYIAVGLHVGESLYALSLTQKAGMPAGVSAAWFLSTLAFGCKLPFLNF